MGSGHTEEQRAAAALIGDCPLAEVSVGGVALTGLLDTGSQVTLMQQSLLTRQFPEYGVNDVPSLVQLKAANGLKIP